ncbi:unnamed protein product [Rangifer tarandus platyrhynchus]|uniref:Uncharacterized protein n=1 Tax=Rangifer tarandus platyrhynchus TaxID=3082113 RepID=A0ABN8XJ47_RANTA|nr:unnamed protein product [Rangifer tarandus platyrhynchus]
MGPSALTNPSGEKRSIGFPKTPSTPNVYVQSRPRNIRLCVFSVHARLLLIYGEAQAACANRPVPLERERAIVTSKLLHTASQQAAYAQSIVPSLRLSDDEFLRGKDHLHAD